ncbi:mechanosensitive ion channel family protein [Aliikangiella coralliicola]|uniref:Mechanosensitive ion channel family protein n=1 Tax=Aliikangiella coralliicola TaxID=2592383 RepID=A0A545U4V1_9GAMM|nr:mechanosensitive ion channel family protein [Aliikangiella coralliicola]TQV84433.1 mechanosensitive ion channel family protein [Aliikangiella coralliicola]
MDLTKIEIWFDENLGDSTFIIKVFLVVFVTLLVNFLWKRIHNKLHKQLQRTKNEWDDALVMSLFSPVTLLIWGVGTWIIVNYLFGYQVKTTVRDIGLVIVVSWFLVRFIREGENNLMRSNVNKADEDKIDQSTIEAISKLLRVSVSITTTLVILQTMGVSISAVLAFGGIGGIAVGFAAKDLLANFFGGLIIYLDRPFSVGDWIRSPDRNIEGTVEYIGWRQTRIRTFDKRPLYVPNAIFNSITVENPSRMKNRRIYETIGIRYDDIKQMEPIVAEVKSMLQSHPDIDVNQTLIVNFNQFSDSSIDFFVYTFTKTTDWIKFHEIKQRVLLKIAEIIETNNAEIAYPTQRIQVDEVEKIAAIEKMAR